MRVLAGCQEVISTLSALCKQTFLMHAMKRGSNFGDQFCTPRRQNLITRLTYRADIMPASTVGQAGPPPAEVAAL